MGFELHFVKSWDGWLIRSPDNIEFEFRIDDQNTITESTGIIELIELFKLAQSKEPGAIFLGPQIYVEIIQEENTVFLRVNDEVVVPTSYEELASETGDLLRESFERMDEIDSKERRSTQLESHNIVEEIYEDLITSRQ